MFVRKVIIIFMFLSTAQSAPMSKAECKNFLKKYGYMSNEIGSEENYQSSLKDYQKWMSLPVTGELDERTEQEMKRPRCGHPDKKSVENSKYVWKKQRLTYRFKNFPLKGLSADASRREFQKAFKFWADYTPLEFFEKKVGKSDIDITFQSDGDGPGKTLAYAYFPQIGDMFFDDEEWTTNTRNGFNLLMVAAHEIGHSLGLDHSENEDALMYPYILPYDPNFKLHREDISKIQDIYGKKEIDLCSVNNIDSAFYEDDAVFITKKNYMWKIKNGKMDSNYPKLISEKWNGSPNSIDAIYHYKDVTYLHDGKGIWKYDGQMKKADDDKQIESLIDDGTTYGDRTYIFKDSNYYRYDDMVMKSGFPKPISSFWTGIPNAIDAVYYENGNQYKYFYFFKGTRVFKFNVEDRIMLREMSLRDYLSC